MIHPTDILRKAHILSRSATVALFISVAMSASADRYTEYIEAYCDMAVEQQEQFGIPASITLAQGLLESAAGRSTLATQGNNHFGIKCHLDWTGPTMLRDDDAPDECFRVYKNASESFTDHSKFLCKRRYQPLFEHDVTDYASWARGLKACGYATDPNYADRLIAIIERYGLSSYDTAAGRLGEETANFILEHLRSSHTIRKTRGLHYIIATPGDSYASLAKEFNINVGKLMEYNDAEFGQEIPAWQEVYLQEKLDNGPRNVKHATIGADDTMHSISQRFGMKLSELQRLNPKAKDRPGTKLRLQ